MLESLERPGKQSKQEHVGKSFVVYKRGAWPVCKMAVINRPTYGMQLLQLLLETPLEENHPCFKIVQAGVGSIWRSVWTVLHVCGGICDEVRRLGVISVHVLVSGFQHAKSQSRQARGTEPAKSTDRTQFRLLGILIIQFFLVQIWCPHGGRCDWHHGGINSLSSSS
jgi:hypothetical protein